MGGIALGARSGPLADLATHGALGAVGRRVRRPSPGVCDPPRRATLVGPRRAPIARWYET